MPRPEHSTENDENQGACECGTDSQAHVHPVITLLGGPVHQLVIENI